ncbi:Protein of unknown function [Neorhodopirellula lusitana]|uniref:DUF1559 domain-containing protein n=1 Tax=Neorhodopirellula lusitana TaxID=445327 RepID=A0ABY1QCK0_9BACT|nr:DUF1559 domain-containing protein [Neorhodopirellula lusitana]SMP67361.1 Protein of unknown function [Neorhodopirellula lusitana]
MSSRRAGMKLRDVVIVLFCMFVVVGLLLPALQDRRGPVRRSQCQTQVKNLALASIIYENFNGELPGWAMEFGHFGWDAETESLLQTLNDPSSASPESGSPHLAPHRKIGSWAVAFLPFLDAQPTYEHWTEDRYPILSNASVVLSSDHNGIRETGPTKGLSGQGFHPLAAPNLGTMQCPSDRSQGEDHGRNSYVANAGVFFPPTDLVVGKHTILHPDGTAKTISFAESMGEEFGVFGNQVAARFETSGGDEHVALAKPLTLDDFRDGAGNTVLFSESLHALPWHRSGFVNDDDLIFAEHPDEVFYPPLSRFTNSMVWHGVDWTGGKQPREIHRINGLRSMTESFQLTPRNAADLARPSSAHTDGVNVGMADGGTRYVTDSIDMRVWQALMTPRGRDSVPVDGL